MRNTIKKDLKKSKRLPQFVTRGQAQIITGLPVKTLDHLGETRQIRRHKTSGGHYRFNVYDLLKLKHKNMTVATYTNIRHSEAIRTSLKLLADEFGLEPRHDLIATLADQQRMLVERKSFQILLRMYARRDISGFLTVENMLDESPLTIAWIRSMQYCGLICYMMTKRNDKYQLEVFPYDIQLLVKGV